ncbi:MAG: RluA family pseudouridine synthase [Bdellovibrionales bacterium]|nr:RluA family pseudouridine synthase [Bdellovibrionales bacterium]
MLRAEILFEDQNLLVFSKPPGMPSTIHRGQISGTAVHQALEHLDSLGSLGNGEAGLLHRLDTATSGVLAFAKTEAAYLHYRGVWKTEVRKIYRAICPAGHSAQGISQVSSLPADIHLEIAHDAKSAKRMRVLDPSLELPMKEQLRRCRAKPRPAHTRILSIKTCTLGQRDLELEIFTGVMHQIRVHLAHFGMPIAGDRLYHGAESSRLWLHAWRLWIGGRWIEAPIPSEWPT